MKNQLTIHETLEDELQDFRTLRTALQERLGRVSRGEETPHRAELESLQRGLTDTVEAII